MKIMFTCGGTAGHINPAVALARMFQERNEGCEVLFVGAKGGMEEKLVPKEGFPLKTVTISSFSRSVSPSGLRHNLQTVRNLSVSKKETDESIVESNSSSYKLSNSILNDSAITWFLIGLNVSLSTNGIRSGSVSV